MASSIETTSTTTTLKNNGNTYMSVDTNDAVTFATGGISVSSLNGGQLGGRRNIVYNGAMNVAQRSASVAGLGAASGYFTLDRWDMKINAASAGRYTMAQVADGPAGFANCMKFTTTTADTSIAAGERLHISQRFEGQDIQHLEKGTATAKQITVSFYVKGNAAATYTCELFDVDNGRHINQSFAVTTAWNRIELTFAADTSDPFDDDNANSLDLNFWLHGGSTYSGGTFSSNAWKDTVNDTRLSDSQTSIFDSTSRTFSITGVQIELGTVATPFEHRSYGTELALCQRYLPAFNATATDKSIGLIGQVYSSTVALVAFPFNVTPRTSPTGITISGSTHFACTQAGSGRNATTALTFNNATLVGGTMSATVGSGLAAGNATTLWTANAAAQILWTGCEL